MKIINKILNKANSKFYSFIIFIMTVCESIFLFIPPEIFITPAIISNKKRTFSAFLSASLGSIVGGTIAYFIGCFLFDNIGVHIINFVSTMEKFQNVQYLFNKYGVLLLIASAITPIPYKLLSICAGFMNYNFVLFILISGIFRTLRFAIYSFILWKFQEKANFIIKKYFWHLIFTSIFICIIGMLLIFII